MESGQLSVWTTWEQWRWRPCSCFCWAHDLQLVFTPGHWVQLPMEPTELSKRAPYLDISCSKCWISKLQKIAYIKEKCSHYLWMKKKFVISLLSNIKCQMTTENNLENFEENAYEPKNSNQRKVTCLPTILFLCIFLKYCQTTFFTTQLQND